MTLYAVVHTDTLTKSQMTFSEKDYASRWLIGQLESLPRKREVEDFQNHLRTTD